MALLDTPEDDEGSGRGVLEPLVVQVCGVRSESEDATQTSQVLPLDFVSYELPLVLVSYEPPLVLVSYELPLVLASYELPIDLVAE